MSHPPIYTIGYGARPLADFITTLQSHRIAYVVDVRSRPHTRQHPAYSKESLQTAVQQAGLRYLFMGHALGDQPEDPTCYADGRPDYAKIRQADFYQQGIGRLQKAHAQKLPVALLSDEAKPEQSHRSHLIGATLAELGLEVVHIDEDGRLIPHHQLPPGQVVYEVELEEAPEYVDSLNFDESWLAQESASDNQPAPQAPLAPLPRFETPHEALSQLFGYHEFRPLQEAIVQSALAGRDSLVVMPTGSGKSLCYQLPALMWDGLTVVVSPLISLMEDQVSQLRELGIPAAYLNSTLSQDEHWATSQAAQNGRLKLLYAAPETLLRPDTMRLLEASPVACLTIDEAHCISQWGHDFRPEYRQLAALRQRLPTAVCLALTATATPRVRQDILATLHIPQAQEFLASFDRENLFLTVQPKQDVSRQIIAFVEQHKEESGIIYCATRQQVEDVTKLLTRHGWQARPYHAGLPAHIRQQNQRAFIRDDVPIMVATIAFGMGINKPNVRFVLHVDLPQDLENYYQQIGRAGRDGLPADCLLLYSYGDVNTIRSFINRMPADQQKGATMRMQAMVQYAEGGVCRRRPLLAYFGETDIPATCTTCDVCQAPAQPQEELTIPAQKLLSCIVRTRQIFGITYIVDVLRGSRQQKILERGHDQLSTYGIGREWEATQWRQLATQLIQQEYIAQDLEHGSLKLTEKGSELLRGQAQMWGTSIAAAPRTAGYQSAPLPHNPALFALLREKRKALADEANVPPYVIFPDRTLLEMATFYPHTAASFGQLSGVGRHKLEKYADLFLPLIQQFCAANGLEERESVAVPVTPAPAPVRGIAKSERANTAEAMFRAGRSMADISAEIGVKSSTILGYLAEAAQAGRPLPPEHIRTLSALSAEEQERVLTCFAELGDAALRPIFDALGEAVSFEELHIMRLLYRCQSR
jgi:ATP-dependent DNA helicase RecQ